jgi:glycosyltransferase involved in cell wall biosynthesis
MNKAIALVMPSKRESFGLVFVEALFAGLPIIYPKGAGVDGYFDGLPFAIAVDPRNPQAIADAMRHVVTQEAALKQALARWQEDGGLKRFLRSAIGEVFDQGLQAAIMSASPGRGTR